MERAIFITAFDRPEYLQRALDSWSKVRGKKDWTWLASVEPSRYQVQQLTMLGGFFEAHGLRYKVIGNSKQLGVLHHPYVRFEELFSEGFDFVVRTEDDLRVSADILEYFTWASKAFAGDSAVGSIHGFQREGTPDLARTVEIEQRFDPLVWGTWSDRWYDVIGPTWDHDYSTNNGIPGVQSGWDWNLNKRVYPKHGLHGVFPAASRVDNFGLVGTHSTPENFYTSASFREDHGENLYAPSVLVDIT